MITCYRIYLIYLKSRYVVIITIHCSGIIYNNINDITLFIYCLIIHSRDSNLYFILLIYYTYIDNKYLYFYTRVKIYEVYNIYANMISLYKIFNTKQYINNH